MKHNLKGLSPLLIVLILLLTGACSIESSITNTDELPTTDTKIKAGQYQGLVPASDFSGSSSSGYKINSTLGDNFSQLKQQTSSGWTVYSSIQGNIISN